MKISTKGRYALRLMLDLALAPPGAPIPLRDVAARQDISDKYLEQIVTPLSRAGLVRSVRGAGGGYLLTRKPAEYTVGEILRPLEGSLAPVSCVEGTDCCERIDTCVTLEVWAEIQRAVSSVVDHMTLAHLVSRHNAKSTAHAALRPAEDAPVPSAAH